MRTRPRAPGEPHARRLQRHLACFCSRTARPAAPPVRPWPLGGAPERGGSFHAPSSGARTRRPSAPAFVGHAPRWLVLSNSSRFLRCGLVPELLLADGGEGVKGKFLLRTKGDSGNDFILSVIYKGAPTHHALARADDGEEFTINKQPTGCSTLDEVMGLAPLPATKPFVAACARLFGSGLVHLGQRACPCPAAAQPADSPARPGVFFVQVVEYLGEKRPKWPVALTEGVASGGGGGGVGRACAV